MSGVCIQKYNVLVDLYQVRVNTVVSGTSIEIATQNHGSTYVPHVYVRPVEVVLKFRNMNRFRICRTLWTPSVPASNATNLRVGVRSESKMMLQAEQEYAQEILCDILYLYRHLDCTPRLEQECRRRSPRKFRALLQDTLLQSFSFLTRLEFVSVVVPGPTTSIRAPFFCSNFDRQRDEK